MRHKRFEWDLGDDGVREVPDTTLKPFNAFYYFLGSEWNIKVWERDAETAKAYCKRHGLKFDGELLGTYPAE